MEQSGLFKKIIAILSLATLILFGTIYYVYSDIKSKNETILTVEQDLSSKNEKHEYLMSLQNLVESIDPQVKKIESSIIPKSGDVAFIEELESLGRSEGLLVEIDSLNLAGDPKISSSTLSMLKVKFRATGAWAEVYKFVSIIESLKYRIKINKFTLSSKEELTATKNPNGNKEWQGIFEVSVLEYK